MSKHPWLHVGIAGQKRVNGLQYSRAANALVASLSVTEEGKAPISRLYTVGFQVPPGVLEKTLAVEPPACVKALPKGAAAAWALDESLGELAYDWAAR